MDRRPGPLTLSGGLIVIVAVGVLARMAPVAAQTAAPPGSTINGTVPTVQGNRWGGLDHQPTPSQVAPIAGSRERTRINRKLNKLDQRLLNTPIPQPPAGGPTVPGD